MNYHSITVDSFVSTALGLYDGLRIDADEAYTALEDNNVSPDFTQDEAKEFARQAYIRMFKGEEAHKAYIQAKLDTHIAREKIRLANPHTTDELFRKLGHDISAIQARTFQGESHA